MLLPKTQKVLKTELKPMVTYADMRVLLFIILVCILQARHFKAPGRELRGGEGMTGGTERDPGEGGALQEGTRGSLEGGGHDRRDREGAWRGEGMTGGTEREPGGGRA